MSYSIYIGEAKISPTDLLEMDEYEENLLEAEYKVNKMEHDDAPEFANDQFTGKSNARHPGYSQWEKFCEITGIHELFFCKNKGLMRKHPGCVRISEKDHQAVKQALDTWKITSSGVAAFNTGPYMKGSQEVVDADPILARLMWLEWWMRHTLDHYSIPAIYNC